MKKYFLTVLCILFLSCISYADDQVIAQRKAVLKALEKVKASTILNYSQYTASVSDAKMELNILDRMEMTDIEGVFCNTALFLSVSSYELAGGAWKSEIDSYGYDSIEVIRSRGDLMRSKREMWKDGKEKLDEAYTKCFPVKNEKTN
ncbi:MAG: hypothetical protein Q7J06_00440 [Bacteroidales bacterium]|nr:hypothetical protein [Bacteroidales bacterium]